MQLFPGLSRAEKLMLKSVGVFYFSREVIFSNCFGKFKSVLFVLSVVFFFPFLPCIVNFVIPVHSCIIVLNVLLQFINI